MVIDGYEWAKTWDGNWTTNDKLKLKQSTFAGRFNVVQSDVTLGDVDAHLEYGYIKASDFDHDSRSMEFHQSLLKSL